MIIDLLLSPLISYLCCRSAVPGAGLEPARPSGQRILSPLRLPIPPSRQGVCLLF